MQVERHDELQNMFSSKGTEAATFDRMNRTSVVLSIVAMVDPVQDTQHIVNADLVVVASILAARLGIDHAGGCVGVNAIEAEGVESHDIEWP